MPNAYRAPKVILKTNWDYKVDVWNVAMVVSLLPNQIWPTYGNANFHGILGLGHRLLSYPFSW